MPSIHDNHTLELRKGLLALPSAMTVVLVEGLVYRVYCLNDEKPTPYLGLVVVLSSVFRRKYRISVFSSIVVRDRIYTWVKKDTRHPKSHANGSWREKNESNNRCVG